MSAQEFVSLREAAELFDVSLSTLNRLRKAGKLEEVGAHKDSKTGSWKIPMQSLAVLGYRQLKLGDTTEPATSSKPDEHASDTSVTPGDTSRHQELQEALNEAERRVAILEAQKEAVEQIARERERVIEVQAQALRMLESTSAARAARPVEEAAPVPASEAPSPAPTPPEQKPTPTSERGGLFSRMFRRR